MDFRGIRFLPPSLPARNNQKPPFSPDSANSGSHSTGTGNQTNIVVDNNTYDQILQKISSADEKAAQGFSNILAQIEDMCGTIYKVPKALPKYQELVNKVKSTMSDFQKVTAEAKSAASKYVNEITILDGK